MKKIDWYILKKFLVTFFFCLLLFTVIAVAVDSSEKTDDFVKTGLSTYEIITKYYFGFVPWIWGLLFPLFVFIAVIFFTSRMATRSEIIAILASGTSYNRFLRPFMLGGIFLALLLWYASRYVIPRANDLRGTFQSTYIDNRNDPSKNLGNSAYYLKIDTNTYLSMNRYDTFSKVAFKISVEKVRKNKMYYNLRAETMNWDTAAKSWKLQTVLVRDIDSMKETLHQYPVLNMKFNIRPSDLRNDEYLKDKLTTPELREFINLQEQRETEGLNVYKVELYRRTATPFTIIILTIIGAVLASRKTRGGSGLHIALGFIIASVFVISDKFSSTFSIKGNFPPLIAAWLPNLVFMAVAYWLYRKAPK